MTCLAVLSCDQRGLWLRLACSSTKKYTIVCDDSPTILTQHKVGRPSLLLPFIALLV